MWSHCSPQMQMLWYFPFSRRLQDTQPGDLCDWFERIARANNDRDAVAREVNAMLEDVIGLVPHLKKSKGSRRLEYQFRSKGFAGRAAMATALILDEKLGLTNRLKRCGNPKCRKFNLDLNPHGRPRRHCNAKCREEFDKSRSAQRMRNWRRKQARKQKRR